MVHRADPPFLTREQPEIQTFHGESFTDPYVWLEELDAPEVKSWMAGQTQHARRTLDSLPEREAFKNLLDGFTPRGRVLDTPVQRGERYFYRRQPEDANRPVLMVQEGRRGMPRALLDLNGREGNPKIDYWMPSPQGDFIVVGVSEGGNEQSVLHIIEVATAALVDQPLPHCDFGSIAWSGEDGFYYLDYPQSGVAGEEVQSLRHHVLGTVLPSDPLIFQFPGGAPEVVMNISGHGGGRFLVVTGGRAGYPHGLFVRDREGTGEMQTVMNGDEALYWVEGDAKGDLYMITTDGAPLGRVMAFPLADPARATWREVVPEGEDVMLNVQVTANGLALETLQHGHSRVLLYDYSGAFQQEVQLPGLGAIGPFSRGANNSKLLSGNEHSPELFIRYSSFVHPYTVFRVDTLTAECIAFRPSPMPIDPMAYETSQVWVTSRDGTRVPMTLVHRVGVPRNAENPTLLVGYGGWGIPWTPQFYPRYMAWLAHGGVLASPHLRGGGEYGEAWHEGGRRAKKQNTFDDFLAAAEWLIAERYTRPQRLAIEGSSNGGLLVGAALTQRPELFGAVVCSVGTLDMLRFKADSAGSLMIGEVGDPDDPVEFEALRQFSPYHQVKSGVNYPGTLLMAGLGDARVAPWHSNKMAARLQRAQNGPGPILLHMATSGGHGAGSAGPAPKPDDVDVLAFLWSRVGRPRSGGTSKLTMEVF